MIAVLPSETVCGPLMLRMYAGPLRQELKLKKRFQNLPSTDISITSVAPP